MQNTKGKKILRIFFNGREKVLNAFKGNKFPVKVTSDNRPKQASLCLSKLSIRNQKY